jgi:hypothetical protein
MDPWSEAFSIHLENARWFVEQEKGRIDGFHQRASYFLGFSGVVLAILPTIVDPVMNTKGWFLRDSCWTALVISVILLSLGALLSVSTMSIRSVLEVPVRGLQSRWVDWTSELPEEPDSAQILADYANALFGSRTDATESALLSLRAEGDVRARRLRFATWFTVLGITVLGLMLILLIAARI